MNIKKKPEIIESQLGVNPFTNTLQILVDEVHFKGQYKQLESGEYESTIADVEKTEMCKLYCSPDRRKIYSKLSPRCCQMMLWIMNEVDYGKDYLWINVDRYMKEHDVTSMNTYRAAIDELIRYGQVTPTRIKDVYWINPDFIFKGDRIKKYPKNVKNK